MDFKNSSKKEDLEHEDPKEILKGIEDKEKIIIETLKKIKKSI
ncbi:MAG: hypothetical protein RBS86_04925 [Candidatus Moranbacteria bacterium]|nr:hypothetical protein [Candidatus Moranbacteria bacterium]